jgi:hypothetical protein
MFMGYVTKSSTGSMYLFDAPPSSRTAFGSLLKEIAGSGQFYRVEELMETQRRRGIPLVCFTESVRSENLHHKGIGLLYQGEEFTPYGYERKLPCGSGFSDLLVGRPLFRAYCYLFAALGVLEIVEGEATALVRLEDDRMAPVSPYDHVTHIRVTPFGAWALGVSEQRPQEQKLVFEAITDKDLLLVTFRGKSLERKLFLEEIGQKLGDERYRISEASFIKGCSSPRDVQVRIERFRTLIDEHPSPRWEVFFTSVLERMTLFRESINCCVYDLSESRAARDLVASDPQLRELVLRVEGNRIAVHEADHQKFLKLLEKAGWKGL